MAAPGSEPGDPVDAFVQRYAMFCIELDPPEMKAFDWLLTSARRYIKTA